MHISRLISFCKVIPFLACAFLGAFPSLASSTDLSGRYLVLDPRAADEHTGLTVVVAHGEMSLAPTQSGVNPTHSASARYRVVDKAFLDSLRSEMRTNFRYADADSMPLDCVTAEGVGAVCKTTARPRTGRQFEIDLSTGYFFFTWRAVMGLKRL